MNTVCELFPHIHTQGFPCVGQGHAIFAANSCAVCQLMQCEFAAISSQICICILSSLWKLPCWFPSFCLVVGVPDSWAS